jgi:outer membrane protein OmpA-like peptidoglycan-associated protein
VSELAPILEQEPDIAGPELQVRLSSQYFSPDNDGTDDKLKIYLSAFDESGIDHWRFEIREPGASNLLFFYWEGEGRAPAELTWDGRSADGELVQSAAEYRYTFSVSNSLGSVSSQEGSIHVDVLVIRDKDPFRVARDRFRMQVPSIVFAPNSGDFEGLDAETLANNDWILGRIALILNRFSTYQVKVEGHANITAESAAARQGEEQELQALSELRARTVVDYLAGLGIDRSRMSYAGIGGSRPVAAYEDRDNWWKNRRVELLLIR